MREHLLDQPRLADAGLSPNEQQTAPAADGFVNQLVQLGQLGLATNVRCAPPAAGQCGSLLGNSSGDSRAAVKEPTDLGVHFGEARIPLTRFLRQ